MKSFLNKKTELKKKEGSEEVLHYVDFLLLGLDTVPEKGWTPSDMSKSITITSKLKKASADEEITLEDAEFEYMLEVLPTTWAIKHQDIIDFDKYIREI